MKYQIFHLVTDKRTIFLVDPDCIRKVGEVYNEMDMPKLFADWKQKRYNIIKEKIEKTTPNVPRSFLCKHLEMTMKKP